MKSTIGANVELLLTDEDASYTLTAYWKKLNQLVLRKFSLRIEYRRG